MGECDNIMTYVKPDTKIYPEDDIVISGRREYAVDATGTIGPEIADFELLNFPAETLPVMVNKKGIAGKTVLELLMMDYMHGVSIKKITRSGIGIKVRPGSELMKSEIGRAHV